jgi:peptidoglycan-associated lipoprotein
MNSATEAPQNLMFTLNRGANTLGGTPIMSMKFLAVAALGLALAACSTTEDKPATSGSAQAVTTTTAPPPKAVNKNAPRPGSQEELDATIGDRVQFGFDRYDLSPAAKATVGSWADWLNRHQNVALNIEGHADERGTREYNLALGARRANAIKDYMTALGVASGRLQTVSFGKERPAMLGSNEGAWAQNRRGVAVVR